MARTRREKLEVRIATAMQEHPDPAVLASRRARLPGLIEAWQRAIRVVECPRCNAIGIELSAQPISYRAGLVDRVARVCGLCVREIKSERHGFAPVYTAG